MQSVFSCNVACPLGVLTRAALWRRTLAVGRPSNTNDFNFIVAVVMSTSLLALVVGVVLPGDWGAFGSYLIGGISLAVLAVGSTAPGLLAVGRYKLSLFDPRI